MKSEDLKTLEADEKAKYEEEILRRKIRTKLWIKNNPILVGIIAICGAIGIISFIITAYFDYQESEWRTKAAERDRVYESVERLTGGR